MDVLPESIAKHVFVQGGAFRIRIEQGRKYRYFFVLNKDAKNDTAILLVTATTKIAKHKAEFPPDVLVEVTPQEYSPLEKPSIINCEFARVYYKPRLMNRFKQTRCEILPPLPQSLLQKLLVSLAMCKRVAPIDIKLALGEEEL